jgi:hypothetical protein
MSRKAMSANSLIHSLADTADPRHVKDIRHPQLSTLTIMVMAMLCGKTSLQGIARFTCAHLAVLAQYIRLPRNKPPSFSTVQRLSHPVDCGQVYEQFNRWK